MQRVGVACSEHSSWKASVGVTLVFLAAGILTIESGLLLAALHFTLTLPPFGPLLAWLMMLAVSLLLPFDGDPTLLAAAIAWAWAIAAPVAPLLGNTIFFSQRYGLSPGALVRQSLPYAAIG